jgi:hypothetical protein
MSTSTSPLRWLLRPQQRPAVLSTILWWEARRLPVNLLLGAYGLVCLLIFFTAINHTGVLKPGDDAVEPLAILLAPFAFNLCYTFGWVVEVIARLAGDVPQKLGPRLLAAGLAFSFFVISAPAAFWGGYVLLQLLGVLH